LAGGTAFLLTYATLPFLYRDEPQAYLTGISAGYMIWLAYLAAKYGNYDVPVRLVGRVKIKYIFYFFLVLDLLLLFTANSGGHVAHLAAALTGWLRMALGNNGATPGHPKKSPNGGFSQYLRQLQDFPRKRNRPDFGKNQPLRLRKPQRTGKRNPLPGEPAEITFCISLPQ